MDHITDNINIASYNPSNMISRIKKKHFASTLVLARLKKLFEKLIPGLVHKNCGKLPYYVLPHTHQWITFFIGFISVFWNQYAQSTAFEHPLIADIILVKDAIFDTNKSQQNQAIHHMANRFHSITHDDVILRDLPFKVGDLYRAEQLEEAERLLRNRPYFANAQLSVHKKNASNQPDTPPSVIITVTTQDAWSVIPGFSYSNIDDETTTEITLTDVNFLGNGHRFSLGYRQQEASTALQGQYFAPFFIKNPFSNSQSNSQDPRHKLDLTTQVATGEQFNQHRLQISQPFRSLQSRNSFGMTLSQSRIEQNIHLRSQAFYQYEVEQDAYTLFFGHSQGLNSAGWVNRWQFGLSENSLSFDQQSSALSNIDIDLIDNRPRLFPWIALHRFNNRFTQQMNLYRLQRPEDIFFGTDWYARLEYAGLFRSEDPDYARVNTRLTTTPIFTSHQLLQTQASITLEWNTTLNQHENSFATLDAQYFWRYNAHQHTVFRFEKTIGHNLTLDRLLTQGGNRGLRGYPRFYQLGNERYQFQIEQRFFHQKNLWQLLQFATVFYLDAGRAWFTEPSLGLTEYEGDNWLWNLGVGWRIGSNRAGTGNILHIDLAQPMRTPPILNENQIGETPEDWRLTIELKSRL